MSHTADKARIQSVIDGVQNFAIVQPEREPTESTPPPFTGLLSGSFNPLHHGHSALRDAAARVLGSQVWFELSVVNADKPPLALEEAHRRVAQFSPEPVVVSSAPTFVEKAALFPKTTFVLGYDTAERLLAPRFYDGGLAGVQRAFETIDAAGCRFLVAGRVLDGVYRPAEELRLPERFRPLFQFLSEDDFRADTSSTEIRRGTI